MKKYLVLAIFILAVLSIAVLAAKPTFQAATVTNPATGEPKNTVVLPPRAVEVAPNIFYLGTAMDEGRLVEGYAFIYHKKDFAKPTGCNNDGKCQGWEDASCGDCTGGGNGDTDTSSCYGFLARGAKWKSIEPYIVDPTNTEGLSDSFVKSNLAADIDKWETAAGVDILGNETVGIVDGADTVSTDGKNEVYFGDVNRSNAIAITVVWGVFRGPPRARYLVEWDQVYDQVDFNWSATGEEAKMDFESIATHELGHSVGLDDLYDDKCSEQTMYGYASEGETNKRNLEDGDIKGVKELYS